MATTPSITPKRIHKRLTLRLAFVTDVDDSVLLSAIAASLIDIPHVEAIDVSHGNGKYVAAEKSEGFKLEHGRRPRQ